MATADEYAAWIVKNADKKGTPEFDIVAKAYQDARAPGITFKAPDAESDTSIGGSIKQGAGNLAAGLVRGAGSIGATILAPVDMAKDALAGKGLSLESNRQRRADMDAGLQTMGAEPDSKLYKLGKLGGEVAGTAGVGGAIAPAARVLGASAPLISAIETGGMALRSPTFVGPMAGSAGANALTRAVGGAITGGAMAGLTDPETAGTGALVGAALPGVVTLAGKAGNAIYDAGKKGANKLMQSAVKPTIAQLKSGDAQTAIQTLLDYGISPTKEGVNKLKELIDSTNDQISSAIGSSNATVSKQKVLDALNDVRGKFTNQVSPAGDLSAIQGVADDFSAHPYFQGIEAKGPALQDAVESARASKISALQAAGKLKTFAAQQQALANGRNVELSAAQPENQLYFNVGKNGGNALSPTAYPVPWMPKVSPKYTQNIDRVEEGNQGAKEAMDIFAAKRAELSDAEKNLAAWESSRDQLPVQLAQQMKQGTYKVLSKKYGQLGSAETEAQKGLARGLKEEIASAVPGVDALNAEESRLITTLSVAERRALLELNKNPVGLTSLAHNPLAAAGFLADRSAAFKAIVARMMNNALPTAGNAGQKLLGSSNNPLLRAAGVDAISASP